MLQLILDTTLLQVLILWVLLVVQGSQVGTLHRHSLRQCKRIELVGLVGPFPQADGLCSVSKLHQV